MKKVAEIGYRIKEYRELNSLTLSDLEAITGIPAQTLNRYELGQRSPKSELATQIAEKMNVNPLWLFGYDEDMEPLGQGREASGAGFQNLIAFRKSLGLNQKEFAEAIGYKHTTYAAYEKGSREPGSELWITISKKYGVSIDYLLGVTDVPFPAKFDDFDDETKKTITAFAKLSPEARQRVLGLLALIPQEQQP